MKVTLTSNLAKFNAQIDNKIAGFRDPGRRRIVNPSPQTFWLEYGGIKVYNRKRRRPMTRLGSFQLPKGGVSVREPYRTVVRQYPYYIVRGSYYLIGVFARQYFRANKPQSRRQTQAAADEIAKFALKVLVRRSPKDTGAFAKAWRIV